MNKSVIISILTLYGAAIMGCADEVVGRAPAYPLGSVSRCGLNLKNLMLAKRLSRFLKR